MNAVTKKSYNKLWIVLLVISLICLMGCIAFFIRTKLASDEMDDLRSQVSQSSEASSTVNYVETPVDFVELKEKNPDIYAWINIPGTKVDYPVLSCDVTDPYYLNHTVDKKKSIYGRIFTDDCNGTDFNDFNTVLYGHNMADGSMFAKLHNYSDPKFFEKNKYIYIYTPDRKLTYEVVSAFIYDDRHIMNSFDFTDDKVFSEYLDTIQNPRSVSKNVNKNIDLSVDDKILVLSTCLNSGEGRYLVQGVLINDEKTK